MPNIFTIASLVPATAAVAELPATAAAALLPEEEAVLGSVSDKRRRDFTLGRECARQALQKLGIAPVPIPPGASRQPLWPPGVCGSITHCDGYCAATAARQAHIHGIGIDVERIQTLTDDVFKQISLEPEQAWIRDAEQQMPWDIILFSAKESVFKAWFPAVGTWIGFEHARIEFDPSIRGFRAIVLPDAPGTDAPTVINGRFHVDDEWVRTSAIIPAMFRRSPQVRLE
jgi:4'-phosphopantetheinyl transferase EntD